MIHFMTLVTTLALTLLAFGACDDESSVSPREPTPTAIAVTEIESLVDKLRDAGMTVEIDSEAEEFFFSVNGTVLLVDTGTVTVFEYVDQASADADAAIISEDGTNVAVPANGSVLATSLFWVSTPHFYLKEKLIVLYVGDDAALIAALEAALGPQFAGG